MIGKRTGITAATGATTILIQCFLSFGFGVLSLTANGDLMRFPLISHDQLKRRRLSEMGYTSEKDLNDQDLHRTLFSDVIPMEDRPHISSHSSLRTVSVNDDQNQDQEHSHRRTSLEVGGLYQGYGTHYVDIWVGTPTPQRQTVIVDTGSGVTAFPCTGCNDCGQSYHASPFFDPRQSKTYEHLKCTQCENRAMCQGRDSAQEKCRLSVSYAEGSSWSASQARDWAYLGGLHDGALRIEAANLEKGGKFKDKENHLEREKAGGIHGEDPSEANNFRFPMVFGCQSSITGLFKTQLADGIMGMCNQGGAMFHQMYQHKVIDHKSFSLCFRRAGSVAKEGTHAGAMTMGGTDERLHVRKMVYANGFVNKGIMQGVRIRKMYLLKPEIVNEDDEELDDEEYEEDDGVYVIKKDNLVKMDIGEEVFARGSTIIDSGTTDTYLNTAAASAFRSAFQAVFGVSYSNNGMAFDESRVQELPTIVIQLEGQDGQGDRDSVFDKNDPDKLPLLAGAGGVDNNHPNDVLLIVPPSSYFEYNAAKKKYIPRVYLSERSGFVLGANSMAGHDILFDISENMRVGIAPSNCNYMDFLQDAGYGDEAVDTVEGDSEPKTDGKTDANDADDIDDDVDNDNDDYYDEKDEERKKSFLNNNAKNDDGAVDDECDSILCQYPIALIAGAASLVVLLLSVIIYKRRSGTNMTYQQTGADDMNVDEFQMSVYKDEIPEKEIQLSVIEPSSE